MTGPATFASWKTASSARFHWVRGPSFKCRICPPPCSITSRASPLPAQDLGTLQALEQQAIRQALQATGGDRVRAAKLLGIGKTTIYRKLKEYGIEVNPAEA